MNKKIFIIIMIFIGLYNIKTSAQVQKSNPFKMVDVPDSISILLEKSYKEYTGFDNVNAGKNVWNLSNRKDFIFKNGIYSFKGQGPHFPRLLFIYNNNQLYTFSNNYINDVLSEYLKCINQLKLSESYRIVYLKVIANYLEEELNADYGVEIPNKNR